LQYISFSVKRKQKRLLDVVANWEAFWKIFWPIQCYEMLRSFNSFTLFVFEATNPEQLEIGLAEVKMPEQ